MGGLGAITVVDDAYYLSFAGGSYELVLASGSIWRTVPESYLRIEHAPDVLRAATDERARAQCTGGDVLGKVHVNYKNMDPWLITMPDGATYTFGAELTGAGLPVQPGATPYRWGGWLDCKRDQPSATCVPNTNEAPYCWGSIDAQPYQWNLVRVEDPSHNAITFNFSSVMQTIVGDTATCPSTYENINGKQYVRDSYPTGLNYGGGTISFATTARSDQPEIGDTTCNNQKVWRDKALDKVSVQAAGQPVRSYKLTYSTETHLRLDSIRLLGRQDEPLPIATRFTYTNTGSGANTQFLHTVSNGQGGSVTLGYGAEAANIPEPWSGNGCQSGDRYVVSERRQASGSGTDTLYTYDYGSGASSGICKEKGRYEFLGFDVVTQTVRLADTTTVAQQTVTWFHQKDATGNPDVRKGKKARETVGDGTTVLQETNWNWVAAGDWAKLTSTTRSLNGQPLSRTDYLYETDHQLKNGVTAQQYGNVTHIQEYRSPTDTTPYRTTERWYYPRDDATGYIANKVAQEKLFDAANTCQLQTRWVYDQNGGYATPPTQGLLFKLRQNGGNTCDDTGQATGWLITQYGYDAWGNRTTEIAAGSAFTRTTTYDGSFHGYPIAVTVQPGAAGGPTLTTQYFRYGINADKDGNGQELGYGLAGQMQREQDPNTANTRYQYDAFGRLTELRKPGTGTFAAAPSEKWTFHDTASPYKALHEVRDDAGNATDLPGTAGMTYLQDWAFYDGLGRVIQTHQADETGAGILVSTRYNALGLVSEQTTPYLGASGGFDTYQPPDWSASQASLPRVITAYDALGRATRVTQPDNAGADTVYNGRKTAVIDALGHQSLNEVDAFGRLVNSNQYTGVYAKNPSTPGWNDPPYATATYTYTVRGELQAVRGPDPDGNGPKIGALTEITYDLAGRKTHMADPDMGGWDYRYDAAGNLQKQRDARGQTLCFYYDGHNRLTGKSYPTGTVAIDAVDCAAPSLVRAATYTYDATTNGNKGLGRRTGMSVPGVDTTTWQYNGRGGVLQETRAIAGAGSFTTAYTYDQVDRVRTMTYPSGEVVTTTYNARGLPATLTGAETYVAGATYDAAGRLTQLQLQGGALQTSYAYSPWTDNPNGGRLQTLRSGPSATPHALQDLAYTYDLTGNVQTITDAGAATTYGYDALARLTTVAGQVRYSYDPTGNLLRKLEPDLGWDLTLAYTDPAHVHAPAVVSDPALAFSYTLAYDNNGNLTSASRLPFAQPTCQDADLLQWDAENRLAQREIRRFVFDFPRDEPYPKGCLIRLETYAHDGDGRMVKRTDEQGEHVFIGAHYEVQPWVAISYYQFGGRRIAMRESAAGVSDTISYLLADHLGSTRAVVSDGAVTGAQPYLPWGEIKTAHPTYLPNEFKYTANTLPTEYTYTGQREASATGGVRLLDYGARSYWPFAGRFISPDSIVPQPGNPQSLNRYAYARNNALRYTDPTGMFTEDEITEYLGVDTWDAVLAFFGEGGRYAGLWGWLEVLRQAEIGSTFGIYSATGGQTFYGRFAQSDAGYLFLEGGYLYPPQGWVHPAGGSSYYVEPDPFATLPPEAAAWLGQGGGYYVNANAIAAHTQYQHLKFDPARIDQQALQDEIQSAVATIGGGALVVGAAHGNVPMVIAGGALVLNGVRVDTQSCIRSISAYHNGAISGWELAADLTVTAGGYTPEGLIWDTFSVGRTISQSFWWSP